MRTLAALLALSLSTAWAAPLAQLDPAHGHDTMLVPQAPSMSSGTPSHGASLEPLANVGFADPSLHVGERLTPHFRVVFSDAAEGAAAVLADELEGAHAEVERILGRPWRGITEVRVGVGPAEYRALALPGSQPPTWAVALAWPQARVVLVEARSLDRPDGHQTLRHELFHAALGSLGTGWPRWFQEGLAQELTGERKYSLEQYATLARAVRGDRLFRFDDLSNGFPERPDDVQIAYAQSAAFVQFLRERYGTAAMGELIDLVGQGDVFETAFGKAFHSPLSIEESLFFEELPGRYPIWPVIFTGTTLWVALSLLVVVGAIRRKRQVAALRAMQLREEQTQDAARAMLRRVRAADNDELMLEPELWVDEPWLVHVRRWTAADDEPAKTADGDTIH